MVLSVRAVITGLTALGLTCGACTAAPPGIESTTALEDTADTIGPYVVEAVISDFLASDVAELRYSLDDDDFVPLVMAHDDDDELFRAAIPGRPAGTRIAYYVTVLRDGARVADDPVAAAADPYRFAIITPLRVAPPRVAPLRDTE